MVGPRRLGHDLERLGVLVLGVAIAALPMTGPGAGDEARGAHTVSGRSMRLALAAPQADAIT